MLRFSGIFTMRQSFTIFCQSLNIHPGKVAPGSPSLCYSSKYRPEILSRFTPFTFFYQSFPFGFLYCWSFDPSNLQKRQNICSISLVFLGLGVLTHPMLHGGSKPPEFENFLKIKVKHFDGLQLRNTERLLLRWGNH